MVAFVLGVLCVCYAAGVRAVWRRAGRGHGVRWWQVWCFVAGAATLSTALLSPIDTLADDLFSAHMIQHVLLAIVAPPLLVVSAPVVAWLHALPHTVRIALARRMTRTRWLVAAWAGLTRPSVACALHAVALWTWHIPAAYTMALEHEGLHLAEHASFLGTASLLWWSIVHPRRSLRASYAVGLIMLFITMLHSGILGALITLSHRVWYPLQTAGPAVHGITPLEDQQLAGLIMWVPGGMLYLIAMALLFLGFMRLMGDARRGDQGFGLSSPDNLSKTSSGTCCTTAELTSRPIDAMLRTGIATIDAML